MQMYENIEACQKYDDIINPSHKDGCSNMRIKDGYKKLC